MVTQRTEHRREDELNDCIERRYDPDMWRDAVGVRNVFEEAGQDGKDESDAHGVQTNRGEDDDE